MDCNINLGYKFKIKMQFFVVLALLGVKLA